MGSIKITILQKDINNEISRELKQKIISQKSDFLILPEFFPFTSKNSNIVNLASNATKNLDNLIELSNSYKGVIIGGSFIREENGKYFHSCPIVFEGVLVDWYDQKHLSKNCNPEVSKGEKDSFYILKGIRFAILMGQDLNDPKLLQNIKNEEIKFLFYIASEVDNDFSFEEDLARFSRIARENNVYLFRSCGIGNLFEKELKGRSLYSSPSGINWKVAPSEEAAEIIKTINLNY